MAKGMASILVIFYHVKHLPAVYAIYVSPVLIPIFFIVSGYLNGKRSARAGSFFYYKVLKQLIFKVMFAVSLTTFSLQAVGGMLLHPSRIPVWAYDTLATAFLKPRGIFFSMLALCSVYFFFVKKICRSKPLPMLLIGACLAVIGMKASIPEVVRFWSWDTALVCLPLYLFGYCARRRRWISDFDFKPHHAVLTGAAYVGSVTVGALLYGAENTNITIATNHWSVLPITLLTVVTGNAFIICLTHCLPKHTRPIRLLRYIGKHSFLYFMFGGPILAYLTYFNELLYQVTQWPILKNTYVTSVILTLIAALLTLIPCKLSDRFCPALNGHFRLPKDGYKTHAKAWIAAGVSVIALAAAIFIAAWHGLIIPNEIYARQYTVRGVDVSSYQGDIDWQTLASQDIDFAFIKATEGSGHVDAKFRDNWRLASDSDLAVGAYHFFSYDSSGQAQAAHFIATVPKRDGLLPPVVDVEFYGDKEAHPPQKDDVVRELRVMLTLLEQHYGKRPIIYTTEKAYAMYIQGSFDQYVLWCRNIVTDPHSENWRFWQYTNRMTLDGYDGEERFIDMNVFVGSEEEFKAYTH